MAAQKGKDLLLKLDDNGDGIFDTVAGLRATRLSFNSDTVDVTTAESAGNWRELLAGAGLRAAAVSGAGIFKDAASDAALQRVFFNGTIPAFEIVIPDFGVVGGPFQVTSLEYSGQHDGEAGFEIALVSAGVLTF
ncbi:MAG: phage major tail protein, TP901-1 family, partial [Paracoccaceae bacterium]